MGTDAGFFPFVFASTVNKLSSALPNGIDLIQAYVPLLHFKWKMKHELTELSDCTAAGTAGQPPGDLMVFSASLPPSYKGAGTFAFGVLRQHVVRYISIYTFLDKWISSI